MGAENRPHVSTEKTYFLGLLSLNRGGQYSIMSNWTRICSEGVLNVQIKDKKYVIRIHKKAPYTG